MPEIRFKQKLRKVTLQEIREAYKKGGRSFTWIDAREFDFSQLDLNGADFSNSDLRFTTWNGSKLRDADFSGCDMEWCTCENADLRGAKFVGANLAKSSFNNSTVDTGTDMTNVDLSWSLLFNVNWGAVKSKGAMIATAAFSPADITEEGLRYIQAELGLLKHLSPETLMLLQFSVGDTRTQAHKLALAEQGTTTVSYQTKSQGGSYRTESAGVNAYEMVKGKGEDPTSKRKRGYENV